MSGRECWAGRDGREGEGDRVRGFGVTWMTGLGGLAVLFGGSGECGFLGDGIGGDESVRVGVVGCGGCLWDGEG